LKKAIGANRRLQIIVMDEIKSLRYECLCLCVCVCVCVFTFHLSRNSWWHTNGSWLKATINLQFGRRDALAIFIGSNATVLSSIIV